MITIVYTSAALSDHGYAAPHVPDGTVEVFRSDVLLGRGTITVGDRANWTLG